jgi:hypothetical protein
VWKQWQVTGVTSYSVAVGHQRFGGPCCVQLHLALRMEAARSSETLLSYRNTARGHTTQRNDQVPWYGLTVPIAHCHCQLTAANCCFCSLSVCLSLCVPCVLCCLHQVAEARRAVVSPLCPPPTRCAVTIRPRGLDSCQTRWSHSSRLCAMRQGIH